MRFRGILLPLILLTSMSAVASDANSAGYQKDYAQWKSELTDDLKKNWLTVVGLFWLKDGSNRVGGDHKLEVPLPEGKVPAQVGTVEFHGGKAVFKAAPGANVTSDKKPVTTIELQPDVSGKPTILNIGDIYMYLIQRGNRYAMRVKDSHSSFLADFKGPVFFPVSQNYIVNAKFVPYDKPRKVAVPTVIGQNAEMDSPGYVEFTLNGQPQHLQALTEGTKDLFFIIKDQTSGQGTYPAGRFLYSDPPKEGKVELDFNRAYNPPCAWTPYATCPLPPKENYITTKVAAGEKFQGHHH
jgi:uncharacterized protein